MMNRLSQLRLPATILISGATGSGKTTLVLKILENARWLISPPPKKIFWFYGIEQESVRKALQQMSIPVVFEKGMPNFDTLSINVREPKLLILDDLISEASLDLEKIFLNKTRHLNFLTILLTQNLFHNNRFMRNISLNVHYFFIFPSKRDNRQFSVLARQIEPKNYSFLEHVYQKLSEESCFNYIMLDLHPQSDKALTVRSDITNPYGATVWLPPQSISTDASDASNTSKTQSVSKDANNYVVTYPSAMNNTNSTQIANMSIIEKSELVRMCVTLKKILHFLLTTKSEQDVKKYIRRTISDSDVILLKEACINILTGNHILLSRKQFDYLNKHKSIVRKLGESRKVNRNVIKDTRIILASHFDILPYIIRASLQYLRC